jgi:hypothetical protein
MNVSTDRNIAVIALEKTSIFSRQWEEGAHWTNLRLTAFAQKMQGTMKYFHHYFDRQQSNLNPRLFLNLNKTICGL